MMNEPVVSVIIPVFNEPGGITRCLDALRRQTYPACRREIIVVDNGSMAIDAVILRAFPEVKWLHEPGEGSYAARNRGLQEATGEVLAFTDSDCVPAPDWLERGVARLLAEPDCGLVGGRIGFFFLDPARPTVVETYESLTYLRQRHFIENLHFGATANLFTFRRVMNTVGVFTADLLSCGDVEWGRRVFAAGLQLVYADEVRVEHRARRTVGEILRRVRRICGGTHQLRSLGIRVTDDHRLDLLLGLVPPVRRSIAWCRSRELASLTQRLAMIGLEHVLHYAEWVENVRLARGGTPRR